VVVRKEVFPEVGCICVWLDVRKNVVDADVDLLLWRRKMWLMMYGGTSSRIFDKGEDGNLGKRGVDIKSGGF